MIPLVMSIAYISIGSNIGDREKNCVRAIAHLEKEGISVTKRSSFYETEPWGRADQPKFLNMALEVKTGLSPHDLLAALKNIEHTMGREKTARWGPRIIDLDILLYDNMQLCDEELSIPHPLMHERDFVLRPLSEIAPDKVHSVLLRTISTLLKEIEENFKEPE